MKIENRSIYIITETNLSGNKQNFYIIKAFFDYEKADEELGVLRERFPESIFDIEPCKISGDLED